MSSNEINELVVALRPEGVDETVDGLEEAQQSFEETTDTAQEESRQLEQFSERFKGALAVATTGLAIAAGSLLNTVPVVGESFSALGAIIQSLGLQIDRVLRPVLGQVNAFLFRTANRIAALRGPTATVVGVITTLVATVGALVGALGGAIFALNAVLGTSITLGGALSTVAGAITTVGAAIAGIIGGISLLGAALAAVVAAVLAFAAAYVTNFMGVRDTTNAIVNSIVRIWMQGIDTLVTLGIAGLKALLAFARFAFESLVAATKRAGNGIVAAFTGWVNSAREIVVKGMNFILDKIEETVNAGLSALSALPEFDFEGINIPSIQAGADIQAPQPFSPSTAQQRRRGLRARLARSGRQSQQSIQQLAQAIGEELDGALPDEIRSKLEVDGREVAEAGSQFRGGSVADRGR